ncbi:hypothetical protein G6F42_029032 [Rhizopus arrhizus]|nr:hypothetical protein G6F42_029032 [Rhizopus arrhizus]
MEMMLFDQQSQADPPVQLREAPRSHQNQAMGNVENTLAMLNNNYKRNPRALTNDQIEQLSTTIKTTLASVVLRSPNLNSNANFVSQRSRLKKIAIIKNITAANSQCHKEKCISYLI